MLSQFTSDYVDKLNAQYSGGRFIKAVELIEDYTGPVVKYFADHETAITFNGQTYQPLRMHWENIKTSNMMPIDGATVTVSNLGNLAVEYLKRTDITDNEVTLRLLHEDLLNQLTGHWSRKAFILAVTGDVSIVTFTVGRRLGRNVLPRKVFTAVEFPGLPSEVARIFG